MRLIRQWSECNFFVLIFSACISLGHFTNKKPWPTFSLQNMPHTSFTCHDKILGGYYADPEARCQMFHVCVKIAGVGVKDFRFLCPNGTAFDQEVQICANWADVDCEEAVLYYGSDNFDLYRLESGFQSKRLQKVEEEESTFHLQRAEAGDAQRSKVIQVDQMYNPEALTYKPSYESTTKVRSYQQNSSSRRIVPETKPNQKKLTANFDTPHKENDINNSEINDDIFKGSHSSNFFSNRNGGREDDFFDKPTTTNLPTFTRQTNSTNRHLQNTKSSQKANYNENSARSSRKYNNDYLTSSSTMLPSLTFLTTSKRLPLQTLSNAAFDQKANERFQSTTESTQASLQFSKSPKISFDTKNYQQHIQATTYNPSGTFRYNATTSRYDDLNEKAHDFSEKHWQNTFDSKQNITDIYKSENIENYFRKPQSTNVTFDNSNGLFNFSKYKTPSGFQVSPRTNMYAHKNSSHGPITLNEKMLDLKSFSSESAHLRETKTSKDREQAGQRHYWSRLPETPSPFAVAPDEQMLRSENLQTESDSVKVESIKQTDRNADKTKTAQKPGSTNKRYLPLRNGSQRRPQVVSISEVDGLKPPQRNTKNTLQENRTDTVIRHQENYQESNLRKFEERPDKIESFSKTYDEKKIRSEDSRFNSEDPKTRLTMPRTKSSRVKSDQLFEAYKKVETSSTTPKLNTWKSGTRGRINYNSTNGRQSELQHNSTQSAISSPKIFSTQVTKEQFFPTTFKPTTHKKAFNQKPIKYIDPKQQVTQSGFESFPSKNSPDENDGQYHPELYEVDDSQNYNFQNYKKQSMNQSTNSKSRIESSSQVTSSPQPNHQRPFQKQVSQSEVSFQHDAILPNFSDEEELFMTAHSLNLGAASINKLRSDTSKTSKRPKQQNSSPSYEFERSSFPTTTTSTTWRTTSERTLVTSKKPKKSVPKSKPHTDADTSYDYAYYDTLSENPHEYSQYDLISEFKKTTVK